MTQIIFNGVKKEIREKCSISKLLEQLQVDRKEVAVERNLKVVQKSDFDTTYLENGDQVEVVRFVGGG